MVGVFLKQRTDSQNVRSISFISVFPLPLKIKNFDLSDVETMEDA